MYYLGEGDIEKDRIVEEISKSNNIIYGSKSDYEYNLLIKESLNIMNERMRWRSLFSKDQDPLKKILGNNLKGFYNAFDALRKGKIDIVLAGNRYSHPFIVYIDKANYVVGVSAKRSLYIGYGLMEAWYADPRIYVIDSQGYKAFHKMFHAVIAYLLTLFIGLNRSLAMNVMNVFDDGSYSKNIDEAIRVTENDRWYGAEVIQRRARIALRGYLNAWFQFMEDASWLEIHHTLSETRIVEKEQSFLDTATTEISETARGIVLEDAIKSIFSAEEMERREKERREKEMDWILLRLALGILYRREKEYLQELWNKKKRLIPWKEVYMTYYEEIWDLIRKHLSNDDVEKIMNEKESKTLGKWHFVFESKKSERAKEKVVTLERMSIEQLMERKNMLLDMLRWEGEGLPKDAKWNDVTTRFRKIMIRYHPDRIEITRIDENTARDVTSNAINVFRELEIIHDLKPEIFGLAAIQEDIK